MELNERLFSVSEFDDDDFFTELEAVMVLLGPKECVVPSIEGDVRLPLSPYLFFASETIYLFFYSKPPPSTPR